MEADRARVRRIFDEAAEMPPAERAAYLDRECGADRALREHVDALLKSLDEAGEFLAPSKAAPAAGNPGWDAAASAPLSEGAGTRIGPYKLLQQIGEGGFGVVFLAEQQTPLVRRVALKIIKLGMDTRQVIARFEAERQALALMDHPNIAKVLDAGATETGRPYFVMELVRGEPITAYCDKNNLSTQERLALFIQTCHAIQHAHQKGIIHRDIKPTNILVTVADGRAIPKVIDFGIAKATISRLTEKTLFTEHRQLIGTPEYMSPEQAELNAADIDTRSDIYSLGVLLYELLTGTTPFDLKQLRSAAYAEIQRIIREVEPPKPSTRISTLGDALSGIASRRHTDPSKLRRLVRGDLDWIVMKALEKERARRYETASLLALDVQRHLSGQPVVAAPPSATYQIRKFVRRHKLGVMAGLAVVSVLVLGVIGTTSGLLWALRERTAAEASATKAGENEKLATQKSNDVLSLSAIQELKELVERADALWPALPEKLAEYDRWLSDAKVLIEGRAADQARGIAAHPSLKDHEAKLVEVRQRAKPPTPERMESDRRASPTLAEWEKARAKMTWMRRMLGDDAWPSETEIEAALAKESLPTDAIGLNSVAWLLVDIDPDKIVYGSEIKALILARRAVAAAKDTESAGIRDTLAWALYRCGRFDEALAEEQRAVDEAKDKQKTDLAPSLKQMQEQVALWTADDARAKQVDEESKLSTRVAGLQRDVNEHRTFEFDDAQDRWWHSQLSQFVADLRAFTDEKTGLYSNGVSEQHGWSIVKRAGFARSIEETSVTGADAKRRWNEAIAAIRSSPKYAGLEITPQIGLLPIGPDQQSGLWEFAHLQTGDEAQRGPDGKLVLKEETGLVLVLIPGGSFWMGAQSTDPSERNYDPQAQSDESPVHELILSPYFLSKYEVTQGQWQRTAGQNPSFFTARNYSTDRNREHKGWSALHPIENVSWTDCTQLLGRLSLVLPTEAQWEYGARAGTTTVYWSGDEAETLREAGNVADAYAKGHGGGGWPVIHAGWDDGNTTCAEVGSYRPNAFGLHDVHGNVWEWCRDGYGGYTLGTGAGDGERLVPGAQTRVMRGGGFNDAASYARSASRVVDTPESGIFSLGLRPAVGINP